jgi:hypothetical protein
VKTVCEDQWVKGMKDKMYTTILHTAPEKLHTLPAKLAPYMSMMSERVMACCDERGEVFLCQRCAEITAILKKVRAATDKYIK